jgi:hypothetical protein
VTPRRQAWLAETYLTFLSTVNALLGSDACASVHVMGPKYVGVDALAGVTVNEPEAAAVVVTFATTVPGMTAVSVIHEPDELAGRLEVEKAPDAPPITTLLTFACGAPNANPY